MLNWQFFSFIAVHKIIAHLDVNKGKKPHYLMKQVNPIVEGTNNKRQVAGRKLRKVKGMAGHKG